MAAHNAALLRNVNGHWIFIENYNASSDQFKMPFRKGRGLFLQLISKDLEEITDAMIFVEPSDMNAIESMKHYSEHDFLDLFDFHQQGNVLSHGKSFRIPGEEFDLNCYVILLQKDEKPLTEGLLTDTTNIHFCAKVDMIHDFENGFEKSDLVILRYACIAAFLVFVIVCLFGPLQLPFSAVTNVLEYTIGK